MNLEKELRLQMDIYESGVQAEIVREEGRIKMRPVPTPGLPVREPMRQAEPQDKGVAGALADIPVAAAGMAKGALEGTMGLPGDFYALGKGFYSAAFPEEGETRSEAFGRAIDEASQKFGAEAVRSIIDPVLLPMARKAGMSEEDIQLLQQGADVGQFVEVPGVGLAVRAGVKAAPGMASKAGDVVEGMGEAAKARMGEGGVELGSGVNPDPAIAAAGDAVKSLRARKGELVGAPKDITNRRQLNKLRRNVEALAQEGADARFWYERSGQAILDAVGGDKDEAEKLIQIIAITSAGTPVKGNFDFALQAYAQSKAGEPITTGRFPTAMSKRVEDVLAGKDWEGRKTNNFYVNLMRVVDPQRVQGVTTDLWMMRSFGFDTENPTDAQYSFVEREVNRISEKLGWEPQQAQAAIWVAQKAKDEGTDIGASKFDYSDALRQNLAQISWESIPGRTSLHMLEMFDAPYEVQQQYHVDISKAFLDDDGFDLIARRLGLPTTGDFEAPGFFEGKVSPGTQTEIAAPRQYRGPKYGKVEQSSLDLMEAYAAVRGVLMKQDGVGYHRPFYSPAKRDENGAEISIGRPFTEAETKQLAAILQEEAGFEIAPIGSFDGVRLINFDDGFDNKQFQKIVDNAIKRLKLDDDAGVNVLTFASQNGYLGNDWSKFSNGEDYIQAIGAKGRPDLQRKVYDLIREIQPRIDAIDADYSEKHGFTRNEAINTEFRQPTESRISVTDAEQAGGADGN